MLRWTAWKQATDTVMATVEDSIAQASGLSGADFAVLTRVIEVGDGSLRQQQLADSLGWKRSRLSRQITRMQERGMLVRTANGPARRVTATDAGRAAVAQARPAHAAAVRRTLLQRVPRADGPHFWETVGRINAADATEVGT
jgi:DNA-binding MarR family transcriptional regulator